MNVYSDISTMIVKGAYIQVSMERIAGQVYHLWHIGWLSSEANDTAYNILGDGTAEAG